MRVVRSVARLAAPYRTIPRSSLATRVLLRAMASAARLPSREAVNQSLWISLNPTRQQVFSTLPEDASLECDVCVVGGGITGVMTASALKERGFRVVLLEGRDIGGGTTGYSTSKLSLQHSLNYEWLVSHLGLASAKHYAAMNLHGRAEIKRLVDLYGIDCDYQQRAHILFTGDDSKVNTIKAEYEAATAAGVPGTEYVTEIAEFPASIPVKAAFVCNGEAQFNAYAFTTKLATAISDINCAIFENTRVTDVTGSTPHTVITAGGGKVIAKHVVLATHLPILDKSLHFNFNTPSRTHCIAVRLADPSRVPQQMYMNVDMPDRSLRCAGASGDIFVVAGEELPQGSGHPHENYAHLEDWAREHFGTIELLTKWSAMDYFPADKRAYIGHLTRMDRTIYTATGFKKWGLTTGSGAATIIADLIQGRTNEWLELFDATRWELTHSAMGIAEETAHTLKHFVGDKVSAAIQHKDIKDLTPGEGGIVYMNGKRVAAFKAADGSISACQAQCSHLGCDLVFNTGDKTFDCPCHGSRFTTAGEVVHGPAVKDLARVALDW